MQGKISEGRSDKRYLCRVPGKKDRFELCLSRGLSFALPGSFKNLSPEKSHF